ncbi:hypothetical protein D3C85_1432230 [compost metagenome]
MEQAQGVLHIIHPREHGVDRALNHLNGARHPLDDGVDITEAQILQRPGTGELSLCAACDTRGGIGHLLLCVGAGLGGGGGQRG